ncbi:MAG: ATPase [Sulfurimonas sp.]|nr:MAG: ATPase [Sulfurimonas sp.]
MIERFYLKELLSFKELQLEFSKGLIVFTGPSGSGKSLLMDAILATLGIRDAKAAVSELDVSWSIDEERYGIENAQSNTFRYLKKEKVRYFVNAQRIPKKRLKELSRHYLKHLSLRDYSDFENDNLVLLVDAFVTKERPQHQQELQYYNKTYVEYQRASEELSALLREREKVLELQEFARFEIEKIAQIDPKEGEDESLLELKRALSKKEKLDEQLQRAEVIFKQEHVVHEALALMEAQSAFFDDAMNELRALFDTARERQENLEETDVESLLDRIEALASLKRRYGSIEGALAYQDQKRRELEKYETLDTTIETLEQQVENLHVNLKISAATLSKNRMAVLPQLESVLNHYLQQLYLRHASFCLVEVPYGKQGCDRIELQLNDTILNNISTGEFNRLRLALLAVKSELSVAENGVLMLDEIDANLSGEESMSVARVLRQLSRTYQIFVISHQPQLTSMGDEHFLVYKEGEESRVERLDPKEREDEIARMISGNTISKEAQLFAKELLESATSILS